ncbi:MAG TPA: hypothetical protein VFP32_01300 [Candidatus Saccharimonadales bacterium]|nr:hypothetical protein [Candidatus Saccharimonadales bacterium]
MNTLRIEAEKLRDQGYSYNMINQAIGVPVSTMSYWFRDRPFKPNKAVIERVKYGPIKSGAIRHNQKVKNIKKYKKIGIKEIGKLSDRDLWMLGIGLYIGEGSKTIESIRIINSDPAVIAIGIKWLKNICGLTNENITVRLHLYPDNSETEAIDFWQGLTGLPAANFRKTSVDRRLNKTELHNRKLPYGTAHVSVISRGDPKKGVVLFRRISGWIEGALNQV